MIERRTTIEAVFIAILDGNKVVLQRRKNTGWMDGWFDLPSGHVEPGETFSQAAKRELKEETRLGVLEKDLELFHVSQNEVGPNGPYTYLVFRTRKWEGVLTIGDQDKVDEVGFFAVSNLPEKTVPYVKKALENIASTAVTFSFFGPES